MCRDILETPADPRRKLAGPMLEWIALARARLRLGITSGTEQLFQRIEDLAADAVGIHMQAQRSRLGNESKRRRAARRGRKIAAKARELRNRHDDWTLSNIIARMRYEDSSLPSPKTVRRYLKAHGVK